MPVEMEFDETLYFEGWNIRYKVLPPAGQQSGAHPIKTVVFVHGTPWNSVTFVPLARSLLAQSDYRILLYDLPGYGQSQEFLGASRSQATHQGDEFQGDTSVKFQASALAALLQHLHIDGKGDNESPAVVAHDIAGTIALRALTLHHCRFQSLLLMDTNCILPWGDGFYKLVRAHPKVFCELPPAIFQAMLKEVIRSAVHNPKQLESFFLDHLASPWLGGNGQRNFVRQIAQANDDDVKKMLEADLYKTVSCPVKILWGAKDQWIPKEKMDRLSEMLQHCLNNFTIIPEAGHLIMVDQPERTSSELFNWLSESW